MDLEFRITVEILEKDGDYERWKDVYQQRTFGIDVSAIARFINSDESRQDFNSLQLPEQIDTINTTK